jgi:YebC/PmpR family DNA-binding regulatory protein
MAGHSKWKQIKRQKGVADVKRGALFTKLGREISAAVKQGGGADPTGNARLRLAVQKARDNNMSFDIIERAIAKASGAADAEQMDDVIYEGYGPGGTAVIVETLTNNRNRTVAEVRNAFGRNGGNLGETGSVGWLFSQRGVIAVDVPDGKDADEMALVAIDAGAEDFEVEDGELSIYTRPEDMENVRKTLEDAGIKPSSSEINRVPSTMVTLGDNDAVQALRMLERLEDLEDVQRVYSNADFPESVLAEYSA